MNNFILHSIQDAIIYPCRDWSESVVVKGPPVISRCQLTRYQANGAKYQRPHDTLFKPFSAWWYITSVYIYIYIYIYIGPDSSTLGQNGRHFTDNIFWRIFLNENVKSWIQISLKCVPNGPIDNEPAFVQAMAWRRTGDKPLLEPMLTQFTDAYICDTRGREVNYVVN